MEDLPLSGLLLAGLLGAGVAFCCWRVRWTSMVMEATCFLSSHIRLVFVACEESNTFSIHSTCRESCKMSCLSELARATPKVGVLVVVLGGGVDGRLYRPVGASVSKPEGLGAGVDCWEVGGGEPTEGDELFTPKESRVH
jgi:hypothetical protein